MPPIVAALLDSADAVSTLRRALPREQACVKHCRAAKDLWQCLAGAIVDVVVVGPKAIHLAGSVDFKIRSRGIPTVVFGTIRPDEVGRLLELASWCSGLIVEGVDDPVLGDRVIKSGYVSTRRAAL